MPDPRLQEILVYKIYSAGKTIGFTRIAPAAFGALFLSKKVIKAGKSLLPTKIHRHALSVQYCAGKALTVHSVYFCRRINTRGRSDKAVFFHSSLSWGNYWLEIFAQRYV
uniref:Uncharacterized protein n=1 Tax=Cannabis sativa TaxID=3483 RepID=A0A803PK70_CANSA